MYLYRFRQGDNVMIHRYEPDGGQRGDQRPGSRNGADTATSSAEDAGDAGTLDAAILEVKKTHLLIAFDKEASDALEAQINIARRGGDESSGLSDIEEARYGGGNNARGGKK